MSDEKSAVGEASDLQVEDAAAELRVAVVQEVDPEPELALLVATNASQCSEDPTEVAEAAYLGRLAPEVTMLFKAHLVTCTRCRQPYEETVAFVEAIRAAAKSLELSAGS